MALNVISKLAFTFLLCFTPAMSQERVLKEHEKIIKGKKMNLGLDVYKFEGNAQKPFLLWKSVAVQIDFENSSTPPDDFVLYLNLNRSQILSDFEAGQKIFGFFQRWSLWKSTRLNPFESTYVGVETKSAYDISLKTNNAFFVHLDVDFLLVFLFIGGICLFFVAKKLSRNATAYYVGGSSVGILLSLMIVVFILYRIVPKRSIGVSMLIGGSSFTLYLLYSVWQNFFTILEQYQRFAAIYMVSMGLISFCLCYYFGPPREIRSQNLLQWTIQLISLIMIYSGCQINSLSVTVITIILLMNNIPKSLIRSIFKLKYRYFPPKPRLLSDEEYIYQGMIETRKALDQLREYCKSPECDSWRLMSRLDTPQRFASFVSGASHLSDDELLRYDADLSTDSDDDVDVVPTSVTSKFGTGNDHVRRPYVDGIDTSFGSRFAERYSFGAAVNRSPIGQSSSRMLTRSGTFSDDDDS